MTTKVVILNWNGVRHLQRFLPSVVDGTPSSIADIVVADNGSTDDSLKWVSTNYPQVEIVRLDRNYGFAEGYNRALAQIEADCFVLLNSDVQTPKGWIEPLIKIMQEDSSVGAAAPKILSSEQPSMFEYAGASGGFIDMFGYPFCRGRIMEYVEQDNGQYDTKREIFWASGACMMVRREAFERAGKLDGDFFAHMEEIDLCWRMQSLGYKIVVEPSSRVYHLGGGTLPNNNPRKLYLNYRNNMAMLYKNLSTLGLWSIIPIRFCLDWASALVFLLQGHSDFMKSVFRAHIDFLKMVPQLKIKRRKIMEQRVSSASNILRHSIILLAMVLSKRNFSQIEQHYHFTK